MNWTTHTSYSEVRPSFGAALPAASVHLQILPVLFWLVSGVQARLTVGSF